MKPLTRKLAVVAAMGAAALFSVAALAQGPGPDPYNPGPVNTTSEQGFGLFQQKCLGCHGNPAFEKAVPPAQLREMTPEHIYDVLTNGVMAPVIGAQLTDLQRVRVAESIAGRLIGTAQSGDGARMPNQCKANPPIVSLDQSPAWNGWGRDLANSRFQPAKAAGLTAADLPKLKLKWAFGFPDGTSAYAQPAIVAGRVFVGSDTGWIYALDAKTGCVHWSFQTKAGVRNAMTLGPIAGHPGVKFAVFFGDVKANVYALDAQTGKLLWTRRIEEHFTNRLTAAPAFYKGRLYAPLSSWEEFSARTLDYPCCTSVGAVAALDANTGRQIWKTYIIPERPKIVGKNSLGVARWAPAGGAVWNTPTLDPKRGALYFGTGDATTKPATPNSDAVMALGMEKGEIRWVHQAHGNDSYLSGCVGAQRTDNCPEYQGPDWDIPSSPVLHTSAKGRQTIIVATKPGDILALDPDAKGKAVWSMNLTRASLAGDGPLPGGRDEMNGVMWGFSDDGTNGYFGLTKGGMVAVDLASGRRAWRAPLNTPEGGRPGFGHAAASTAIPGAVMVGGSDGGLVAASTVDGHLIWSFDTARSFDTVNKVKAHGGSIGAPGPTVAGGMVFVGSGYAVTRGNAGNVLLAFGLE